MSNYRTVRELKSYKGTEITRLHRNGRFSYFGFMGDGTIIMKGSLKELRREIDIYDKAELC